MHTLEATTAIKRAPKLNEFEIDQSLEKCRDSLELKNKQNLEVGVPLSVNLCLRNTMYSFLDISRHF